MQNMIAEVFEKMNEFAQKRDVSNLSPINDRKSNFLWIFQKLQADNLVLKTIFTLQEGYELNQVRFQAVLSLKRPYKHNLETLSKEEADHFDMQGPITIQVADKEKIGRIETGHHKMKVSAIYNIKSFKFNDQSDRSQTSLSDQSL